MASAGTKSVFALLHRTERSLPVKKDGKTSYGKKSRRKSRSEGKIAGQGMKKDSVTTLLFQANNENFAELFNRTLLADETVRSF